MTTPRNIKSEIEELIAKGVDQGYLTLADVNDHLPEDLIDPDEMENIIGMINDMGIVVHESAPDIETLLLSGRSTGSSNWLTRMPAAVTRTWPLGRRSCPITRSSASCASGAMPARPRPPSATTATARPGR